MLKIFTWLFSLPYAGHKKAWHVAFHEEFETAVLWNWSESEKKDGWHAEYKKTCSKCDAIFLPKRFYLNAAAWRGVGSKTEAEAYKLALEEIKKL